jgi:hypothetical protein
MNTYLGASAFLGPEDVPADVVGSARVVYLEGYLWDRPEAKEAYRKAARVAHDAGNEVSLTLSDPFCVDRHRPEWLTLVREDVDVLFANEAEIRSLYETDFDTAIKKVTVDCKVAAVRALRGSVIVAGDDARGSHPSTGSSTRPAPSDLCAGFLFGYRGLELTTCAAPVRSRRPIIRTWARGPVFALEPRAVAARRGIFPSEYGTGSRPIPPADAPSWKHCCRATPAS